MPTLRQILTEWQTDSTYEWDKHKDPDALTDDIGRMASLHAKYLAIYFAERSQARVIEDEYNDLRKDRQLYYTQMLSDEVREARGWPKNQEIAKSGAILNTILDGDPALKDIKTKMAISKEKVQALEYIMKRIDGMNYVTRSIIDWEKFKAGH